MAFLTLNQFLALSAAKRAELKELCFAPWLKIGKLGTAQLQQFAGALQDCQLLESLVLTGHNLNALDAARLAILGNALQRCSQLKSLELSCNNLGVIDAARLTILSNTLQRCSRLQSLDLGHNNLGKLDATCLTILGDALQRCQQLQSLDLSLVMLDKLDAARLTILGDALQRCSQLQSLDLRGNFLDEPVSNLIDSILSNPSVFVVRSNNISETQHQTLKNHYLNAVSKKAYQHGSLLLQPWKNEGKLPNELLFTVLEFEITGGLLPPTGYQVSPAEINAALKRGFNRAEEMRAQKVLASSSSSSSSPSLASSISLPPASSLTFSSAATSASSPKKRHRQNAKEHVVPSNAKQLKAKQGSMMIRGENGVMIRRSCRLLGKK